MNKVRFAVGVASIALSPAPAFAQTATAVPDSKPAASQASTGKQTAAERRRLKRQKRDQRITEIRRQAAARKAVAQQPADRGDEPSPDIVVTGTRIASNYGKTGAPVQTLGRSELDMRGLAHLEDALNSLPAVQPSLGNQTRNTNNNPASFGQSPVNLRNLGSGRTLMLVNGQRATNDTNNIPAAMIERIEVLTGAAGAIYGSDAVGGVINIILKRNYTGITLDGEGTIFQHTNDNSEMRQYLADNRLTLPPKNFLGGPQGYLNASTGFNFDGNRGNITAHAGYRVTTALQMNKFDTTACALGNGPSDNAPPGSYNDHSQRFCVTPQSYNPYGFFGIPGIDADQPGGPTDGGNFSNAIDGSKTFRPYTDTDRVTGQPQDYIYRSDKRFDWGLNARYMLRESSQTEFNATYSHAYYSTTSTTNNYGEIGAPNVHINCDNPFLSQQQATTICGTNAGDPNAVGLLGYVAYTPANAKNIFNYHFNETRITGQLKSKITDDIRVEANFIRTDHQDHTDFNSYYSSRRLADGLRARSVDGKIVCLPPETSPLSADPGLQQRNLADDAGCQPIDIFSTKGPSQAAYNYLTQNPGVYDSGRIETVMNGTVSGTLGAYGIKSPFAKDALGFAFNVENRRIVYAQVSSGASYGLPVNYTFQETDISAELALPLIQDVRFIKSLQLTGAFRQLEFPDSSGNNWRVGVNWNVVNGLSLRSSYSTSFRVDPYQTYYPNTIDSASDARLLDLCSPPGGANPVVQRLSAQQCVKFGVTAQQYAALSSRTDCNEVGYCPGNILNGGNPALKPEQGASFTAGMTITPVQVRNLSISIDYYRNKITNFISYVDPYISFIQCQAGTEYYCGRYHRDPTTGRIDVAGSYADGRPDNFGYDLNTGVDFVVDYKLDLQQVTGRNIGQIGLTFTGNWRLQDEQQKIAGEATFDCTGYYGYGGKENCGAAPSPWWRHTVRAVWALPWSGLALNALWRYSAPVEYAGLQSNPILSTPPTATDGIIAPIDAYLPASSYLDVGATIKVGKAATMRLTITNILDTDPYLMVNNHGGWYNTQPLMYDVLGRKITLGFTANF